MRAYLSSITKRQWIIGGSISAVVLAIIISMIFMAMGKAPQSADADKAAAAQKLIDDKTAADAAKAKADADEAAKAKATPAPVPTTVTTSTVNRPKGEKLQLFLNVYAFKIAGKPGVDCNIASVPYEVELDAEFFSPFIREQINLHVERQMNCIAGKVRKITKLKYIVLTLSRDGSRYETALVAVDATENGVDMAPGKSVGITIKMSVLRMDEEGSETLARDLNVTLQQKFGRANLGAEEALFFPAIDTTSILKK